MSSDNEPLAFTAAVDRVEGVITAAALGDVVMRPQLVRIHAENVLGDEVTFNVKNLDAAHHFNKRVRVTIEVIDE